MVEYRNHILLISKPYGITSSKFTNLVKKILKARKAGHTGTLDPIATGLMVIALNDATKFIQFINTDRKEYVIRIILGKETDTDDITGNVSRYSDKIPEISEIESALKKFIGKFEQEAPAFSAKKINGVPFYELARKRKAVPKRKFEVEIYGIEVINYKNGNLDLRVSCSKGTYMRSLARDIGKVCGSAATLGAIARTKIGNFSVKDATTLTKLKKGESRGFVEIGNAISYPSLVLKNPRNFLNGIDLETNFVKVFDENGKFLGMGRVKEGKIHPEKVLNEDLR